MAKYKERIKARRLRREKGMSIKEIAKKVGVAKSTVSLWCRDVELTDKQRRRLYKRMVSLGHKGRLKGARINKRKKEVTIERFQKEGLSELQSLSKKEFLIAGLSLCWGEGSKGNQFMFSNSDPEMILFIKYWLQMIMEVDEKDFIARVLINEIHRPRIKKVLRFWKSLLDLPSGQFRDTTFVKVKPKKVYENYNQYYGTLQLRVRGSANLQYRIGGLIQGLIKSRGSLIG